MNFKNVFEYEGTADRTHYWAVYIGSCLFMMVSLLVAGIFATVGLPLIGWILLAVTAIGIIWASVFTLIKRCRDIGISPLFSLALLIPTINVIVAIVFGCLPTNKIKD
jgi:uncharacterized membrane protein YhaH (DUF805 family)